jgi:Protein of unknown function (DUF3047)
MFQRSFLVLALALGAASAHADPGRELMLDVHKWRVIDRESGPVNYYKVVEGGDGAYIHAAYSPPWDTTVLGYEVPDEARERAHKLRWTWRALALPREGNECLGGHGDSAATVYVSWKRGLRWYTLKYVWSATAPRGAICDRKRNMFVAQDIVVTESGGPVGVWKNEEIDLQAEFRKHFADGDPGASVPDFQGVAIMTDGDQTASVSAADFAGFTLVQ